MIWLLLAAGLVLGAPPARLALLGVGVSVPWLGLPLLVIVSGRGRTRETGAGGEAGALIALAAELRAGRSLRQALGASGLPGDPEGASRVRRLADLGWRIEEVAAAFGASLGRYGRLATAAVIIAHRTGGRAAAVLEVVAAQVVDEQALRRELHSATAGARLATRIVGGLPALYLAHLVASRRLPALIAAGGPVAGAVVIGSVLVASGLLAVVLVGRERVR